MFLRVMHVSTAFLTEWFRHPVFFPSIYCVGPSEAYVEAYFPSVFYRELRPVASFPSLLGA